MREGRRAVLGGLVFNPNVEASRIGPHLLGSLLASISTDPSIRRIESQFISFGLPWLSDLFCSYGFTEYRRAFLRRSLAASHPEIPESSSLLFEFCRPSSGLGEASQLMQEAHVGSVDAEMNELYRTREGCRTLLDNILHRRGCGEPIDSASFVALDDKRGVSGLVIATEISPGHSHLAQVAVSPAMQGQGLGKVFLHRSLSALSREGFQTVSLMVSDSNRRAYALYDALGFEKVLCFPVFSWDSVSPRSRSR
jgi:ribosomal protein S18 acetylase RimI-like enzyme